MGKAAAERAAKLAENIHGKKRSWFKSAGNQHPRQGSPRHRLGQAELPQERRGRGRRGHRRHHGHAQHECRAEEEGGLSRSGRLSLLGLVALAAPATLIIGWGKYRVETCTVEV